ncbi:MAG: penicillin-binding protein [Myxococcota bacterium]|nr:penicillin-binding protein [Myxococcota bacterium]
MSRRNPSYRRLKSVQQSRSSQANAARLRSEREIHPRRVDATVSPSSLAMRARVSAVLLVFFLGWGLLLVRAGYLTVGPDQRLSDRLSGQHERVVSVAPQRGSIVDRLGRALAVSGELFSAFGDPTMVEDPAGAADLLAPILGMERADLITRLSQEGTRFVWLDRQLPEHVADSVRDLGIPGVGLTAEAHRRYPSGPLAAQILGFVGVDGQGLEGLEGLFDSSLMGEHFEYRVIRDGRRRATNHAAVLARRSTEGKTLVLTLDHSIQHRAELELAAAMEKHDARAAWAVVMEPGTGRVLAMASLPSFDPNAFRGSDPARFRHRATEEIFEPGSTVKPFVVAEVLEAGLTDPEESIFCENGSYQLGRNIVHDHHPHGYLTVEEILQVSSNIGLTKLGERLGPAKLEAMYRRYGFGRKTLIEVRDEAGILRPSSSWSRIGFATHTFGQGMAVTAIQEVAAFSALVNGGMSVRPHLVAELRGQEGELTETPGQDWSPERVLSAEISSEIRRMMGLVVEEGGTGVRAALADYSSGGKTGTAQKVKDGRYAKGLYVSSFIGFAPRNDPRVVTMVVLDEPKNGHFGSTVAGPAFKSITTHALRELGVAPDLKTSGVLGQAVALSAPEEAPKARKLPVLEPGEDGWTMPDLAGRPLRDVVKIFGRSGVALTMDGSGLVSEQSPKAGVILLPEDVVRVALSTRGGIGNTK